MPRFVLIDHYSGFIFGDTANFAANRQSGLSPVGAARLLDETLKNFGCLYAVHPRSPRSSCNGYAVYRVDIDGSEVVPVIANGESPEAIAAVERHGKFECFVERLERRR